MLYGTVSDDVDALVDEPTKDLLVLFELAVEDMLTQHQTMRIQNVFLRRAAGQRSQLALRILVPTTITGQKDS